MNYSTKTLFHSNS